MHLLERARTARGWGPTEFTRRLQALGALRGVPVGTGRDGLYRWEKRDREPDAPTRRLIAELLGIPGTSVDEFPWPLWIALDPLQQPTPYSWNPSGAVQALGEVSGRTTMRRRQFTALLTGPALTSSLWAWLVADPAAAGQIANGRRLGESSVAHIEERVRQLRHADDIDGGGQLLTETSTSLDLVVRLLKDRTYSDVHGARLHAAAADIARMHAWAAFDVHEQCADATFQAALRSAQAAGDTALGAHILAFWSIAANNTGRPQDAEAMTDAALSAARGRTTPRAEAMLLSRRARARAHQNSPAALADLDHAAELLHAAHPSGGDPEWVYWFDRSELLGAIASTYLDLGQPARADDTFVEAAGLFPADRTRTQSLFLARRADAQWRQDDPERACDTAHRALDLAEETSSHRAAGSLRELAASMNDRVEVPAVREFRERIAALAA
jgi:tetratricopeptide (TPR) repeat protein